jgi:hypothetical protein
MLSEFWTLPLAMAVAGRFLVEKLGNFREFDGIHGFFSGQEQKAATEVYLRLPAHFQQRAECSLQALSNRCLFSCAVQGLLDGLANLRCVHGPWGIERPHSLHGYLDSFQPRPGPLFPKNIKRGKDH